MPDPCLTCSLPTCNEKSPGCVFTNPERKAKQTYYQKIKDDPEYKKKQQEINRIKKEKRRIIREGNTATG